MENCVHHHLKGGGRVGKTEEHDCGLKQPFMSEKCCFPLVTFLDSDIVVAPPDIEGCKEGTTTEAVDDLWDEWGYIAVADGPFVNRSIVLYGA